MSIDISVDANLPIPFSVVLESVTTALCELLDVAAVPAIHVVEVNTGIAEGVRNFVCGA